MRSWVKILALALLLLPRVSAASVIDVTILEPTFLDFGPGGATFFGSRFDDIFLDGLPKCCFSGHVEYHAGPLQSLTLSGDADRTFSNYEFGPGTFTLAAHGTDEFGAPVDGSFVAPLLTLSVDLCEGALSTDPCGRPGFSSGEAFATFGAGLFDPNLAHALGINRSAQPFSFRFRMDQVSGDPSSNFRFGGSVSGRDTLSIDVTVPEPSALALLLLSAIGVLGSGRIPRLVATRATRW
jgi:hypothetical protein